MTILGVWLCEVGQLRPNPQSTFPLRWFKNNCVSATAYFTTGFQRHKKQARQGVLIVLWSRCVVKEKDAPYGKANPPVIRPARPCLGQAQPSSQDNVAGNFSMLSRGSFEVWCRWPSASQVLALNLVVSSIGRARGLCRLTSVRFAGPRGKLESGPGKTPSRARFRHPNKPHAQLLGWGSAADAPYLRPGTLVLPGSSQILLVLLVSDS